MRRGDKEITDRTAIESILQRAEICRIALSDNDMPYIVPVNFGYVSGALYLHSSREGRKIEILKRNDRVCFEADIDTEIVRGDTPCSWGTRYSSVIGTGRARILTGPEEVRKALDIIMRKYEGPGPFTYADAMIDAVAVIRIDIDEMTGKKSGK